MPNQSGKIVLVLLLLLLILGASSYFYLSDSRRQEYKGQVQDTQIEDNKYITNPSPSLKTEKDYYSKNLKISIKIPQNGEAEEKFTDINVKLPNGQVQIRRIGTNFKNIKEYFENLKKTNKLDLISEDYKIVNGYESVLISIKSSNTKVQKEYSLYADNWVFKFATSEETLYPVLDQIVQSFEYKGTMTSGEDKP